MRRSEQVIEVPERVYRGPHYSDAFKKAWCKLAALDVDGNYEHCNASVANMAAFSGMSKSAFERALKEGREPGPDGGPPEFTTARQTHRGGRGRTAIRQVRGVTYAERHVTVPVWIAEAAEPRELAAVLLIAHAEAAGHALTAEELAGELFHHHGKHKGQPLSERTARRLITRCEEKGFLEVDRRAGYQGRHLITVRATPLQELPGPDNHDGSGPVSGDGSLAYKEDQQVCTDGSTHERGPFRRRRGDRKWVAPPVDTPGNRVPDTFRPAPGPRPADSDPVTLPPRVWAVLEPVQDLLPDVRPFVLRRIAREVTRQLDTGVLAEDITDQLRLLRAWTPHEELRDPGRWIVGAALPARPGPCGLTDCVRGFMRHTGAPCKACADHRTRPNPAEAPSPPPQPPGGREQRQAPPPRATPHARPPAPPSSRIGPPPVPGGWRALVARERPRDAARAYRHRWTGDHARLLPPDTA